jgi:hypothetical protein
MPIRIRFLILRFGGVLLIVLGILHLAVTPLIAQFVWRGASPTAVGWLIPPMLLNHVVVGILLLPLGSLTVYAAPHAARGEHWALVVSRVIAATVATLPPTLFFLMGTAYDAVPFRWATGIVCAASVTLLAAAFWPPTRSLHQAVTE